MTTADGSVIGPGAFVRGRITGDSDLQIQGRIEGEIEITGDVSIDGTGMVAANVSGKRLVVRGAVKGDLTGTEAIELEAGARVVGDIRAPRISIAAGALVRGLVATGASEPSAPSAPARRSPASTSSTSFAAKSVAKPATAPRPEPRMESRPEPKHDARPEPRHEPRPRASAPRVPPLPVVPALKKGAKAVQKKRA